MIVRARNPSNLARIVLVIEAAQQDNPAYPNAGHLWTIESLGSPLKFTNAVGWIVHSEIGPFPDAWLRPLLDSDSPEAVTTTEHAPEEVTA